MGWADAPLDGNRSPSIVIAMNHSHVFVLGFALTLSGVDFARAASSNAEFTAFQRLTNREMFLRVTAPTGGQVRFAVSTNLATWQSLVTASNAGVNTHTDSAAPFLPARFYRAEMLTGTNALTGDHLAASDGEFVLHAVNHASLVVGFSNKLIYIDPVGASSLYAGLPKADLILITHSHSDHYSSTTIDAVRRTNTAIVAPAAVYSSLSATLKALTGVLTNGMTTNLLGFTIDAIPAYNLTTSNHPKGVGNGYVLSAGGRRIYFTGDSEDIPEMRALQNIDVAFVCMNLPFTMTAAKAASTVRDFRPKVVYPYHYRDSSGATTNATYFKQLLGTDLGIEVRLRPWY